MGLSIAAGGWAANLIVFLMTEFNVKSIAATKIYNLAAVSFLSLVQSLPTLSSAPSLLLAPLPLFPYW
jgi:hypothetical protein